ncbi:MAG: peptidase M28 family protein, partial [Pseudomonadota bacterium]
MTKRALMAAAALLLAAPAGPTQEAPILSPDMEKTVERLIASSLNDTIGLQFVEDVTTEVGPRLAGSEQEQRARDWATQELSELGFKNIRVETFTIPFWSRVEDEVSITAPVPQEIVATALGGSAETAEDGVEANVVRFENLRALGAAN